ncbi:uncharacterized protein [Mytilus edulis]|uniref:uncharacterized protein n=1 Tax=Mytilus edulis TaxID=6550 RepID=UPI0039EF3BC2
MLSKESMFSVLISGGAIFTIYGKGFNNVWEITVERVDKSCDVPDDTFAVCETPPRLQNQPNNQTIDVHFDGLTIQVTLEYVNEPAFQKFQAVLEYDKESTIRIQGRHILSIALREDYHIDIGLDGTCLIVDISMDFITCVPPKSVPMTNNTDVLIVHVIVNVIGKHIYIGDIKYTTETNALAIVVWILGAGLVGFVIICLSAVTILRRQTKAANEFKIEIKAKKEIVQRYGREGVPERRRNVRSEDENEYTEPDESIYDEVNIEEENNTRENSYLDVHEGYDELGQRSPPNPYNQLQQARNENQRQDMTYNETNEDDELQCNIQRHDYLILYNGYKEPISRNDPDSQLQVERF